MVGCRLAYGIYRYVLSWNFFYQSICVLMTLFIVHGTPTFDCPNREILTVVFRIPIEKRLQQKVRHVLDKGDK
jgi:hypothetical protein